MVALSNEQLAGKPATWDSGWERSPLACAVLERETPAYCMRCMRYLSCSRPHCLQWIGAVLLVLFSSIPGIPESLSAATPTK
ncbi:hypothetical protein GQ53DRAFT_744130 [Thozetella sp. PMI_491]|nr:hypothetical protein GQ53DRAFT_744130 [Thozetella sp. PMI_491]